MIQTKLIAAAIFALSVSAVALAASQSTAGDERAVREATADAKPSKCVSTPIEQTVVIDRKTLLVTDYRGNAVLLKMAGDCLSKHEAVGIEFFGSGQICRPLDVTITGDVTSAIPTRCMISKVEPISREEAKALESQR